MALGPPASEGGALVDVLVVVLTDVWLGVPCLNSLLFPQGGVHD